MRNVSFFLSVAILFLSCAGGPKNDPEKVNDLLISFSVAIQAKDIPAALEWVTLDEQLKLLDGSGEVQTKYLQGMRSLKLSTLQKQHLTIDGEGRLVGIFKVIESAAASVKTSKAQKSNLLDKMKNPGKTEKSTEVVTETVVDEVATENEDPPAE